jgi:hypothetical protein
MFSAESLRPYLITCGYPPSLLKTGAQFAGRPDVALVGFAHEPMDARSACVAAINAEGEPLSLVKACRSLGAPVVLAWHAGFLEVYRQSVRAPERATEPIAPDKLDAFFAEHKDELEPHALYRLKTRGLLEGAPRQLTFVDVGFMRHVDDEIGQELTGLVERAVDTLASAYGARYTSEEGRWILKWAFRLLAGKILRDKGVPKFKELDLLDYARVSELVGEHYAANGARLPLGASQQRAALARAADLVARHAHLGRVTTEALADVYESALVTKKTRKALGTHSTPSYLADYVVWQLADWIEKIPVDSLRVWEPACGHAAFLVSMMRFVRESRPTLEAAARSRFYRDRFGGIDIDAFAVELAKLSLTLADIPNPNGWGQITQGNMFANRCVALRNGAANCTVALGNPPFEAGKALRVLQETLQHVPLGGVFGFVLPQAITYSPQRSIRDFRQWLVENTQLREVCVFPQGMFKFADHEAALLLGRRVAPGVAPLASVTVRKVRDTDQARFKESYSATTSDVVRQRRFLTAKASSLWVPDLDYVWAECCASLPKLEAIAEIGKGFDFVGEGKLPEGAITASRKKPQLPGFKRGFKSILRGDGKIPNIHEQPELWYLNMDSTVIATARAGAAPAPQVLLNYGRVTRIGTWRVVAYVDAEAHPFTSRFLSVRPRGRGSPLEYVWALCMSPLANAFVYSHTMKRDNTQAIVSAIPVPRASSSDIRRVVKAAKKYRQLGSTFDPTRDGKAPGLFDPESRSGVDAATLRRLLLEMDAEVLRLYALPASAERQLLDLFATSQRKGVPFDFGRYYPEGFKPVVPLHIYLSKTYQRYLRTGDAEVAAEIRQRYDELIDKRLAGSKLTSGEESELYRLESEMDGGDYASEPLDDSWQAARAAERQQTQSKLDEIANVIINASQAGGRDHAHRS